MKNKKVRYIVLCIVLVAAGLLLKGVIAQRRTQEAVKTLFSQLREDNISMLKVNAYTDGLAEDSADIRGGELLQTFLSIIHTDEPFTLVKNKDYAGETSSEYIYVRTSDDMELLLKCLDGDHFVVSTDDLHGFAGQDDYSLYLPALYSDVIVPAIYGR